MGGHFRSDILIVKDCKNWPRNCCNDQQEDHTDMQKFRQQCERGCQCHNSRWWCPPKFAPVQDCNWLNSPCHPEFWFLSRACLWHPGWITLAVNWNYWQTTMYAFNQKKHDLHIMEDLKSSSLPIFHELWRQFHGIPFNTSAEQVSQACTPRVSGSSRFKDLLSWNFLEILRKRLFKINKTSDMSIPCS